MTLGAVLFSLAMAGLVVALAERPSARPIGNRDHDRAALPVLALEPEVPVAGTRTVPDSVLSSAGEHAAPWAPGLALVAVRRAEEWSDHRAVVEDTVTGDVRSYAIGDLLPHGSLLVGIGEGRVEVLVADRELVEMRPGEPHGRSLLDFREARAPRRLSPAPELPPDYVAGALEALAAIQDGAAEAQAAIDALIAAGEPVIEVIIARVDDDTPIQSTGFELPSGSGRWIAPVVLGDVVIGVLERITGQTFGDVTRADLGPEERRAIRRAWLRWWGL